MNAKINEYTKEGRQQYHDDTSLQCFPLRQPFGPFTLVKPILTMQLAPKLALTLGMNRIIDAKR